MFDKKLGFATSSIFLASALLLTGCGDSSSSDSNEDQASDSYTPETQTLSSATVLDANNEPLAESEVSVLASGSDNEAGAVSIQATASAFPSIEDFKNAKTVMTDVKGLFSFEFTEGEWYLAFKKDGGTSIQKLQVTPDNASKIGKLISSLSCSEQSCVDVDDQAIVGSISGIVYSAVGPVQGAEVGLSGGSATNGVFSNTLTDENGQFTLTYNVSNSLEDALKSATIRVVADGFKVLQKPQEVTDGNVSGVNLLLVPVVSSDSGASDTVVWEESFETDSPTFSEWIAQGGYNESTVWQRHQKGSGVTNALVAEGVVYLAPDDVSKAALPDPAGGSYAYWYGDASKGNFIGERLSGEFDQEIVANGGTSVAAHEGTLTSPAIDLSDVASGTPVSVSFKTWWEIESVNPNNQGFDLMDIEVSTDGENFQTLARLNPLSDPQSGADVDRSPLPYSNNGYNKAPSWITQEPISLSDYAGEENVYIRWKFATIDGLYNGFRGWLIDDVVIEKVEGTFPLFESGYDTGSETMSTVQGVNDSQPRWSANPER